MKRSKTFYKSINTQYISRQLLPCMLAFFLLAHSTAGQKASLSDCQHATLRHTAAEALRQFYAPYSWGRQFDGPAQRTDEDITGKESMVSQAEDYMTGECARGRGAGCDDYQRTGNAYSEESGGTAWTRLAQKTFSVNPQTCAIRDRSGRTVTEADAPEDGLARALWLGEFRHGEFHKTICESENGGRSYPNVPDPAPGELSDYSKRIKDHQQWASEERNALWAEKEELEKFLKENCGEPGLEFSDENMNGQCGEGVAGKGKLKHTGFQGIAKSYRVRTPASPETLYIPQREPVTVPAGQNKEAEVDMNSDCGCCTGDSVKSAPIHIYGGPNQSVLVKTATARPACEDNEECGSASGDPHLCTHDGVSYDFQGVGEFVLAKTEGFEVQARFAPFNDSKFASVNTAVAAKINGDRIAIYAGDPVKLLVNGKAPLLRTGESIRLPGGALVERVENFYRFSKKHFVVETQGRNDRLLVIRVGLPEGTASGGLFGDRNKKTADDFRLSGGEILKPPIKFEDLYQRFGNSWRVTAETSLFDYGDGESVKTFAIADFPMRLTSVTDLNERARQNAEAVCRKAGVEDKTFLENCVYDIALTKDESFAEDAAARKSPPRTRLVMVETRPPIVQKATADGIKIEVPSEAVASYNVEIKVTGPAVKGYKVRFAPAGSQPDTNVDNPYSSRPLEGGDEVLTLHAPYLPGNYELRYLTTYGEKILLSIPFRATEPKAEIVAASIAEAGKYIDVRMIGDVSPNSKVNIVPVGSPLHIVRAHNFLQGGIDETVRVNYLPKEPGEYEIRYSSSTNHVIYARRKLTIYAPKAGQ